MNKTIDVPHYLPGTQTQWKAYLPSGVRKLFQEAVKSKNGDINLVFKDKHNNKNLIELWHASWLALAIYKYTQIKFSLISVAEQDPDIHFLTKESINTDAQYGFPVEVTELFFTTILFSMEIMTKLFNAFKIPKVIKGMIDATYLPSQDWLQEILV